MMSYVEANIYFCALAVFVCVFVLVWSWLTRAKAEEQKVYPYSECDTCGQYSSLNRGLCSICEKTYQPKEK
jgi:hypothetical protein